MKILAPLALLAAALTAPGLQAADEGPWMVRVSAARLAPTHKSDAFFALDTYYTGNLLQTTQATLAEVALNYNFTKYFSAAVSLATAQTQTLTLIGTGDLGVFKAQPSTFTLQWHFNPGSPVNPYVGLGMNATRLSSANLSFAGNPLSLSARSVGTAVQAGLDIHLAAHWCANVQLEQLQTQSDLNVAGAKLTTFTMNPMLYSVGIAYKF